MTSFFMEKDDEQLFAACQYQSSCNKCDAADDGGVGGGVLSPAAYSPALSSSDYPLFPSIQNILSGKLLYWVLYIESLRIKISLIVDLL